LNDPDLDRKLLQGTNDHHSDLAALSADRAQLRVVAGEQGDRGPRPVDLDRRRLRLRVFRVLGPLFVLLLLWIWLFYAEGAFRGGPSGKSFGADFGMFMGAAKIVKDGGNPYDRTLLYRTEQQYLAQQHLPILKNKAIVRVGNPPLFFWALSPLTRIPFQPLSWAWTIFLYLMSAAGFLALLRYFGWRGRVARVAALLVFLLAPQVVFGPFYGNGVSLVFAAVAFALLLSDRHPILAGALLSVAWLKPPPALPVVLLIFLFHIRDRRSALLGFGAVTAVLAALMIGVTGVERVPQWIHGLTGYSQDINVSPDIASFSGLYVRNVAHGVRLFAEVCSLAVALILTVLAWHRYRSATPVPYLAVAWLWMFWFLAAPYAHFFDEVLLTVPILTLVGQNGEWITRREAAWGLSCALASLLLVSASPLGVQLLWLPLVVVMLCLYTAARSPRYMPWLRQMAV
jgi:hypothetical protein